VRCCLLTSRAYLFGRSLGRGSSWARFNSFADQFVCRILNPSLPAVDHPDNRAAKGSAGQESNQQDLALISPFDFSISFRMVNLLPPL
jgi:hypothetical protein